MTEDTRTPADRIAAIERHGHPPVSDDQRARATAPLADVLAAAGHHGVTLADLDWTIDLPGACVDVVRAQDRRTTRDG